MWLQFILTNLHFSLGLFSALIFFAAFWLYLDAWLPRRTKNGLLMVFGFLFLSLGSLTHSAQVESAVLGTSFASDQMLLILAQIFKIFGSIFLLGGLVIVPLQPRPESETPVVEPHKTAAFLSFSSLSIAPFVIQPFLTLGVALLFLRRAITGLEAHLKPLFWVFFLLFWADIFNIASYFRNTTNVSLYELVAPFGFLWTLEHLLILAGILVLLLWVFKYLLKRFLTQIFMILTSSVVVIFLITTIAFTALLLKNIQDETLNQLETNVKVLSLSIESKKGELLSDAQMMAQDAQIQTAMENKAKSELGVLVEQFLLTKKQSLLLIVNKDGQVLVRGEDPERTGDSLSSDPLVRKILGGESVSTVAVMDGVLAPEVSLRSGSPVVKDGVILGGVVVGSTIDAAFVEGLNRATGLAAAIYGQDLLSASTLGARGIIGTKEENQEVLDKVLKKGEGFTGGVKKFNALYFASYLPLKDIDNVPVGMLLVGKPQVGVLQTAGRSIQLTFVLAIILIIISIFPSFMISRYLTKQIR